MTIAAHPWNSRLTRSNGEAGDCRHCGTPMMTQHAWRAGRRPAGYACHMGRGLCDADYTRWRRNGSLARRPLAGLSKVNSPDEVPVYTCTDCDRPMVSHSYLERWPELTERFERLGSKLYCATHYRNRMKAGTLERTTRSREEVLEDWAFLRDDGVPLDIAARRMGMKQKTLEQALYRARKRGDERGSLIPFAHDVRRAA